MSCPYANPSPNALDHGVYDRLHRDGKRLISAWATRAHRAVDCDPDKSFEPFIFMWIAFNAWGACVTGEDRDAEMVRRTANCPRLRESFRNLTEENLSFRRIVESFADLWPIFKAQDIRRSGYLGPPPSERAEVIRRYREIPAIAYEPSCGFSHIERTGSIPVDWPHCLHTIYRVRCNLFHGEKSLHSEMDARVVKGAFDVLARFFFKNIIPPNRLHRTRKPLRDRPAGEP